MTTVAYHHGFTHATPGERLTLSIADGLRRRAEAHMLRRALPSGGAHVGALLPAGRAGHIERAHLLGIRR